MLEFIINIVNNDYEIYVKNENLENFDLSDEALITQNSSFEILVNEIFKENFTGTFLEVIKYIKTKYL